MNDSVAPIMLFLASGVLGWFVGGMTNALADELPARRPLARGTCRFWHYWTLGWYWLRRGQCPHCGERRAIRAPLLEAAMITCYVLAAWRDRVDALTLVALWAYSAILLTVLVIDFEQRKVLNVILLPAALLALLFGALRGVPGLVDACLGGAVGFILFLLLALMGRGRLGAGDVKLAGAIGLMVGFSRVFISLGIGICVGGLAGFFLLISRRASRKSRMAYAPYLAFGALVTLLFSGIRIA
jgi:prepilin signal peptidase PulO-like enzyme (type II secretory pathway)